MPTTRHDGWTTARQIDFLRGLSRHGIVTRAADDIGMGVESAYRLRARDDEFAEIWDMALECARKLLMEARLSMRKYPPLEPRPRAVKTARPPEKR